MKSFVDIGILLSQNKTFKKNMQKANLTYKDQAEIIKKKFVDEGILIEKLRNFVSDKKVDFEKLMEHVGAMEVQYNNFLQLSEDHHSDSPKEDLEKTISNEIKKREILLLQNQFMKEQLHRLGIENEKVLHLIHILFESSGGSKSIIEALDSVKDTPSTLNNCDFFVLQHLQKEVHGIKTQQIEVQSLANHILGELNTDFKDVIREIASSFKHVKHEIEQNCVHQASHLAKSEHENEILRKQLEEFKTLSEELKKELQEVSYKAQCLEENNLTISAKYNDLRHQAAATVTLAEDAQIYREELSHIADVLLAQATPEFPCKQLRPCIISRESAKNISNVLEMTLDKYNSRVLDLEKDIKTLKLELNKKHIELEENGKARNALSANISELSRQLQNCEEEAKQRNYENSKLQENLNQTKEELYRAQHLITDLNTCVDVLEKEKHKLKEVLTKMEQQIEILNAEKVKLMMQLGNYKTKDEAMLVKTMAIEEDKIKLKEEVISYQQNLQDAYLKLDLQEQQILEDKALLQDYQSELTQLRKDINAKEDELKHFKSNLDGSSQKLFLLETKLKEMNDERLILERDNGNLLKIKQSLNDDMNILKRELLQAENIKTQQESICEALENDIKNLKIEKQKMADMLAHLHREKGETCNKLTCISRKKEYLNVELLRLQQRFEQITEVNRKLNSNLEELLKENEEKQRNIDKLEKENTELNSNLGALTIERQNLEAKLMEWSSTLEETSTQKEKLQNEVQNQNLNQENMKHQIELLKKDLGASVRSIISLKKHFSKDIINLENEFLKKVSTIKTLSEENIKKHNEEKAQAQQMFEENLQKALQHLEMEKDEQINKILTDLHACQTHSQVMMQRYEAALKDAENEKQALLSQIQKEKQEVEEQCQTLKLNLNSCQSDLTKQKRESRLNQDESKSSLSALKQEIQNLNQYMQTTKDQWDDRRNAYEVKLKQISDERDCLAHELNEFKTLYKIEQDRSRVFKEDLDALAAKYEETENLKDDLKRDLIENKKQLQEAVMEKEKYFDILSDQKENIKSLENQKIRLNAAIDSIKNKLEKVEDQNHRLEKENTALTCNLDEYKKSSSELGNNKSQLEDEIRRLNLTLSDKKATENELRLRLNNEIEEKERISVQLCNACKKVSELETINDQIRGELHHHSHYTKEKEHKWHEYEMNYQKQFDEQRCKEQKLQDKIHNLEICLSDATQQIQELNMTLGTFEDKIRFLDDKCLALDKEKHRIMEKYGIVSNILRNIAGLQIDGSINLMKITKGTSLVASLQDDSNFCLEPDQVNTGIRALMSYIMQMQQEKDSLEEKLSITEKDNVCLLERQKSIEQKMNKFHHALRACQHEKSCLESKMAQMGSAMSALEDEYKAKINEIKQLQQKLGTTETNLKNLFHEKQHFEDHFNQLREKMQQLEMCNSQLQDTIKNLEAKCAKLDLERLALDGDLNRAESALREKDMNLAGLSERSDKQMRHIACLEERCEELQTNLKKLQHQNDQLISNEHLMRSDLKDLQKNKAGLEYNLNMSEDKLKQMHKNITGSENERKVIMERLESAQNVISDLKRQNLQQKSQIERFQQRMSDLEMSKSDLEAKIKMLKTPLDDNRYRSSDESTTSASAPSQYMNHHHHQQQQSQCQGQQMQPRQQIHFNQATMGGNESKINLMENNNQNSQKLMSIRQALSSSLRNVAGDPNTIKNERKRLDFTLHDYKKDCF